MSWLTPRVLWLSAMLIVTATLAIDWRRLEASARAAAATPGPIARQPPATEPQSKPAPESAALRVLFIGNGTTRYHGLPNMIVELARAAGERHRFEPVVETVNSASLATHLEGGRVQPLIAQGGPWHAVVLQEHDGYAAVAARELEYTMASVRTLQTVIIAAGARAVLFAPYARRSGFAQGDTYDGMQERVNQNIRAIEDTLHVPAVPVGEIWQRALRDRPSLALWEDSGLYPTPAGCYLAACAFYAYFYGKTPVGNTYMAGVATEDARFIQETVAAVMALN